MRASVQQCRTSSRSRRDRRTLVVLARSPAALGHPFRQARAEPPLAQLEQQRVCQRVQPEFASLGALLVDALRDARLCSLGQQRVIVRSLRRQSELLLALHVHQQHRLL